MKCEEIQPLHGAYLDSELDSKTTLEIQLHLAGCPDCARAFAAEAKGDARMTAGLKRGRRTAALWERIEQHVVLAAASNRPCRKAAPPVQRASGWREWLWPCPQAWAGLAAVWVAMIAVHAAIREPAVANETRQTARPSPQTRQMLQEQRQMLAELGGIAEKLNPHRSSAVAPQPRSQRRSGLLNT